MAPADSGQNRSGAPFRRVTPGLPVGGRREAEAPLQLSPPSPVTEDPQVVLEPCQLDVAPTTHQDREPDAPEALKAVVVDGATSDLLPPIAPRPLHDITGLTLLLRGMAEGGEPLGSLVLPTRAEQGALATPAMKKVTKKGGVPANGAQSGRGDADAPTREWPSGPLVGRDLFTANEVQRLVEAMLMDEDIMEHPSSPGLTRARLREVARAVGFDPNRFGRLSAAILVWFARAGVTVLEDDKARNEWARPRPIASRDRAEIRRLLWCVDPPDGDAVAIARAAGLDSLAP